MNPRAAVRRLQTQFQNLRNRWFEARLSYSARQPGRVGRSSRNNEIPVVVSLTTHGARLAFVHVAIESILRQTVKPQKVILWISDAVAPDALSDPLRQQMRRGLEVRRVPDVGPQTKIVYALREYPEHPIVTVDDDVLYPSGLLGRLYRAYCDQPQYVHCHRAHRIRLDANGRPRPYADWQFEIEDSAAPSFLLLATGVGGVLYPPGSLHPEVTNERAFRRLCPTADDLWLKAMTLLNGVKCKRMRGPQRPLAIVSNTQSSGLQDINIFSGRNDPQLRAVLDHYELYDRLCD